jgi:hypothetical protein
VRVARSTPLPANGPGDFGLRDGCCTLNDVSSKDTPVLLGEFPDAWGNLHGDVKRELETAGELDRMIAASQPAELGRRRYRGNDRRIELRLVENGERGVCDNLFLGTEPPDTDFWEGTLAAVIASTEIRLLGHRHEIVDVLAIRLDAPWSAVAISGSSLVTGTLLAEGPAGRQDLHPLGE